MKWTGLIVVGLAMLSIKASGADIVAHRGASADAPENTLAAYRLAWEQQADAIEGDFRFTIDKQIVCLHDATTDRTTGHKARLDELTLAQVRELDAGSWKAPLFKGERIPTLGEVLAAVPREKRLVLEIKIGPEIVPDIKQRIEAARMQSDQVVIIAFDEKVIEAAKQAMPDRKALWLYDFKKKDGQWSATQEQILETLKRIKADGLDVGFTKDSAEIVNDELSRKLREAKLELHVWTVDDAQLAPRAVELGAKSITTNRPAALRRELAAGGK